MSSSSSSTSSSKAVAAAYARLERDASLSAPTQPSRRGVILVSGGGGGGGGGGITSFASEDEAKENDEDLLILLSDSGARFSWAFHGLDPDIRQNIFEGACAELPVTLGFDENDIDALACSSIFEIFLQNQYDDDEDDDTEGLRNSLEIRADGTNRSPCESNEINSGELIAAVHSALASRHTTIRETTGGLGLQNYYEDADVDVDGIERDEALARLISLEQEQEQETEMLSGAATRSSTIGKAKIPKKIIQKPLIELRSPTHVSNTTNSSTITTGWGGGGGGVTIPTGYYEAVSALANSLDCICSCNVSGNHSRACAAILFTSSRTRATELALRRSELLRKASAAFKSSGVGASATAGVYAERARELSRDIHLANQLAAHATLLVRNKGLGLRGGEGGNGLSIGGVGGGGRSSSGSILNLGQILSSVR